MLDSIVHVAKSLAAHEWLAILVLAGLAIRGLLELVEWLFAFFVDWTRRMRVLWQKLWSPIDHRTTE